MKLLHTGYEIVYQTIIQLLLSLKGPRKNGCNSWTVKSRIKGFNKTLFITQHLLGALIFISFTQLTVKGFAQGPSIGGHGIQTHNHLIISPKP